MIDVSEPLEQNQARKLVAAVYHAGGIAYTAHALREMANDRLGAFGTTDVNNVLKHGRMFEPCEFERGSWRYRLHTARFCVVVAFRSETELVVVTCWRKRP